jgi:hypothetical protein
MKSEALGLVNLEAKEWDSFFFWKLIASNIRLREEEDKLVWARNLIGGFYKIELGYEVMLSLDQEHNSLWCWNKVWKIRAPLKCRLFQTKSLLGTTSLNASLRSWLMSIVHMCFRVKFSYDGWLSFLLGVWDATITLVV